MCTDSDVFGNYSDLEITLIQECTKLGVGMPVANPAFGHGELAVWSCTECPATGAGLGGRKGWGWGDDSSSSAFLKSQLESEIELH